MNPEEVVVGTRRGVGLFEMAHRGLLEVRGEDRARWLDGMISGDVQALDRKESGSGCYAVFLTNRGAIIADFHVARFEDHYLLESLRSELPRIQTALERYVIADDVTLLDRSADFVALGLEGPGADALLERATKGRISELADEHWVESAIGGRDVLIARFGFSGEGGFQIRMKPDDREGVEESLGAVAKGDALVHGNFEALEILRIEAGLPLLGAELDEEVLPAEARLERAISTSKGCYVGQEIVARLRARGKVNHLLVGLRLDSLVLPEVGATLQAEGRVTGELTSVAVSPTEGPIALGYVRREHAETGTEIELERGRASVAALPFVAGLTRAEHTTSGVT